jgi:transcriptional regulator with XRE-family HTH domain
LEATNVNSHIGDAISTLRRQQQLSVNELARRAGITASAISRVENHHHDTITPDNLSRVAVALGVIADPEAALHRAAAQDQEAEDP